MALTLDGSAMLPSLGMGGGSVAGGIGAGAIGGGLLGLLAGAMLGRGGFGGWGGYGGYGGWGGPAANAATTSVVLDPAFESLQNQISGVQDQLNANGIHSEINELEKTVEAANIANLQGISQNALGYQRGNAEILTAQANGNFTTLTSINNLGRDITAANTQALINNLQNFNTLSAQLATTGNQLIAGQASQSAQMAACCCELKQTIVNDGNATRQLINDLNVQNLRDQLNAANVKVSNNEQNQYLLSTILAHLKPVVV